MQSEYKVYEIMSNTEEMYSFKDMYSTEDIEGMVLSEIRNILKAKKTP